MKYLVAGRVYSDYKAACSYADLLHRIANLIVAVEAVSDDFENQMRALLDPLKHPPANPN